MSHLTEIKSFFTESTASVRIDWKKTDILCLEGEPLDYLHFIESGRFRVFRSLSNGRDMLYRIYLPGSIMGDIELFTGGEAASCSVQCIEAAKTISLPTSSIRDNLPGFSELIFLVGKGLARKLHENSVSEAVNTNYPLEVRLAHYYLEFKDPELKAQNLIQLSEWMGCSYRHLTRSLSSLCRKGAVKKTAGSCGSGYLAADRNILEKIAGPVLMEEGRRLFEPGDF